MLTYIRQVLLYRINHRRISSTETDHVPSKVCSPIENGFDPTNKLKVLRLADPLLDQKQYKTRRYKGHSEHHTDGHQDID